MLAPLHTQCNPIIQRGSTRVSTHSMFHWPQLSECDPTGDFAQDVAFWISGPKLGRDIACFNSPREVRTGDPPIRSHGNKVMLVVG